METLVMNEIEQDENNPESYIQVVFREYGSTIFDLNIGEKVNPLQLYALIGYLKTLADNQLQVEIASQMAQAAQQQLAVPQSMDEIKLAR